jgi:dihydrofolate reductase
MATQYYAACSLDGFIATLDDSLDWLLQFGDVSGTSYPQFIRGVGALAMGSITYEWILANGGWSYQQPAWVFTSRILPKPPPGANVKFVHEDVAQVYRQMASMAGHRNIWIVGGGELAGQFYDRGLLDELIVQVAPVLLGRGKPLLPRARIDPPMKRTSVETYGPFTEIRYSLR